MFKNIAKDLNIVLIGSLGGGLVMTWLAPIVIKILFTPPVSFGTNCEPAAAWSMHKLAVSQISGVFLGAIAGAIALRFLGKREAPPVVAPKHANLEPAAPKA